MTQEQIELPTVSNVDQDLQREPEIREGYVLVGGPVKWVPYKPQGAKQMKRKGRWKAMNEYGGWDNCETPAQIWSGFISYEDMAAHIIALEARVDAAVEEERERCAVIADIQRDVCGLDQNGAMFVGEEAKIFASSVAHEISTAIRTRATGEAS